MEEKSMLKLASTVTEMREQEKGDFFIGKCHVCKENGFTISEEREHFYCFSCHSGGLGYEGLTGFINGTEEKCSEELAYLALDWFEENITEESGFDRSQLTALGIKDSIAGLLRLGYFPLGKTGEFAEYMIEKGATEKELAGSHLAFKNTKNGKWYSPYEGRIVWPKDGSNGLELGGVSLDDEPRQKYYNCDDDDWKCVLMAEEDDFRGRETKA